MAHEIRGEVEVDIEVVGELDRVLVVVAGANQLLESPAPHLLNPPRTRASQTVPQSSLPPSSRNGVTVTLWSRASETSIPHPSNSSDEPRELPFASDPIRIEHRSQSVPRRQDSIQRPIREPGAVVATNVRHGQALGMGESEPDPRPGSRDEA